MNKPSHVPPFEDLAVNFENSLGNNSGLMPTPVSCMLTVTSPLQFLTIIETDDSEVLFIALLNYERVEEVSPQSNKVIPVAFNKDGKEMKSYGNIIQSKSYCSSRDI